jgi:AraC family transcriptional regulator of adaptative response/methylated-DNA-[protein]-cysteine methyltransferase
MTAILVPMPDQQTRQDPRHPVERARAYLDAHLDERVTLDRLAQVAGLSPHHLQRTFKRVVGLSPSEYAQGRRAERLRGELRSGATVSRAIFEAGYGSSSRVYERADETLGMTPADYRRGGRGVAVRYAVVDSPYGRLLVGVTDRGVCAVMLGEDDAALAAELRREYPQAELARVDDGADEWLGGLAHRVADAVARGVAVGSGEDPIPLDVRGTAFQWQVWRALQRIPAGETRTYTAVATALGRPTAARAVARACASNRLAVVVPCHRVVREDGSLGGYRWGLARKARLLEAERVAERDAGRPAKVERGE